MLLAVVEHGGFSGAAEKIFISHSAIHRRIRLLEKELDVQILVRVGKRVQLTPTGRSLIDLARRIENEITKARAAIKDILELRVGHLWIGTSTSILISFLPSVIERFRNQYPGIEVRVVTGTGDDIVHGITAGVLDVGVVYSPTDMPPGESAPYHEILYTEEMMLAVSRSNRLSKKKSVTLAEVIEYPFIMYPKSSHVRRALDRIFTASDLAPEIILELETEEAIEKMIAIDMGISFFSKTRALSDEISLLNVRDHHILLDIGMVFPTQDYMTPPMREFANMCRKAAKKSPRS